MKKFNKMKPQANHKLLNSNMKILNNNRNLKSTKITLKKKIGGGSLGKVKYFPSYAKE